MAHTRLVDVINDGTERPLSVEDGQLRLDLGPMVARVEERLASSGLGALSRVEIDPSRTTIVHAESDRLGMVQTAIDILDVLANARPLMVVMTPGLSLLTAPRRWSMLMWAGVVTAVVMVVLLILLGAARAWYLDDLDPERSKAAFATMFEIVGRNLRTAARMVAGVALGISGVAALATSSWIRTPSIVSFVVRHRSKLLAGIIAIVCTVMLVVDQSTVGLIVGMVVIAGVMALGVFWLSHLPNPEVTFPKPVQDESGLPHTS